MSAYLLRRIVQSLAVVIGVMILTFILVHLEPGSAARAALGLKANANRVAQFNKQYGLNEPVWRQFISYANQLIHGRLGISYTLQEPVTSVIKTYLPRDIVLLGISTVTSLLVSIPVGIYQAVKRNKAADQALTAVGFTLYAMPDFFFAILLIAVFSIETHILPPGAPTANTVTGILAQPKNLVLPVVTLTLVTYAGWSRYIRSSALDVLGEDYIRLARAKGLSEKMVMLRHGMRNCLLPIITMLGLSLPGVVGGAVIAEEVFNYKGMGFIFYQAATQHDYPILLGFTLFIGVATVVGNLAADIAYAMADPRIKLD